MANGVAIDFVRERERERERMADGEEVKREHLEGDREEGCVKGLGC